MSYQVGYQPTVDTESQSQEASVTKEGTQTVYRSEFDTRHHGRLVKS